MPAIKPIDQIAEKWARVTPGRSADYEAGIRSPKKNWEEATAAAESAWAQGVQDAIQNKRFGKGVKEAGTGKWQRKALEIGVGRWGPGVSAAERDYRAGFAPFRDVIERTELPPRYRRGDPRNIERVAKIAAALHEAKVKAGT